MALVTLSDLRTRTRQRSDMVNSQFISDSELNSYINAAAAELWDICVQASDDFGTLQLIAQITASPYVLPTNLYRLRGVDLYMDDSMYRPVRPFNFTERNNWQLPLVNPYMPPVRYQIVADKLWLTPEQNAPGQYRLWYVETMPLLTTDSSTFDGQNGFEEYVITDAAIRCLEKEESDTSAFERQKLALKTRVLNMVTQKSFGETTTIADVRSRYPAYGQGSGVYGY